MVTTMITTMPRMLIQKPRRVSFPDSKKECKYIMIPTKAMKIDKNVCSFRDIIVIPIITDNTKIHRNTMKRTSAAQATTISFFIGNASFLINMLCQYGRGVTLCCHTPDILILRVLDQQETNDMVLGLPLDTMVLQNLGF